MKPNSITVIMLHHHTMVSPAFPLNLDFGRPLFKFDYSFKAI